MTEILPKGTKITCPRKGHMIAVAAQNLKSGTVMKFADLDFEDGQEVLQGSNPVCNICGSAFIVQNKIHTSDGWMPEDPILETPR